MKVLVFAPHPDDELIGCGGSIAKHISKGHKVTVVYMTSGEAGSPNQSKEKLAIIREREAVEAAEFMGINNLIFLKNKDGLLKCTQRNILNIIKIIMEEKPQIIYIPHPADRHKDHIATNKIVIQAVKKAAVPCQQNSGRKPWAVKLVLCYEVWAPLLKVSFIEDITEFVEIKAKAASFHKSQAQNIRYNKTLRKYVNNNREHFHILKINN